MGIKESSSTKATAITPPVRKGTLKAKWSVDRIAELTTRQLEALKGNAQRVGDDAVFAMVLIVEEQKAEAKAEKARSKSKSARSRAALDSVSTTPGG